MALSLVVDRHAIQHGFGRWEPWGANPNTIATTLAATAPLALYLAFRLGKRHWAIVGAVSIALLLITGSRGSLVACIVALLPLAFKAGRRPLLVMGVAVV